MAATRWNPELYQASHSFVWEFGRELVDLLAPRPGERILDVGCGTGQLTAEIAGAGAETLGIDSSPAMIEQARGNFPDLRFEVADVTTIDYHGEFDAVFSNAVLHWVKDADAAAAAIGRALKPGGRFVAELGGRGNIRRLLDSAYAAMESLGVRDPARFNPWYYPSLAEYAAVLARNGLEVTYAALLDRLTPLEGGEGGLDAWLAMFGGPFRDLLPDGQWDEFVLRAKDLAAADLLNDGQWFADYRRLRVVAVK